MFAVLLTGPPGAGKTSVLTALHDALSDDDVAHAAIEVEMLAFEHPGPSDEQRLGRVRATCAQHRASGHRLVLVAETLETDDDVARLVGAVGADEHVLVRLEARPATLAERIVAREPAGWSGLAQLVEHARELATTIRALDGVDLVLSTEGEQPEAVAERIRAAFGPLRPAA